MMFLVNFVCDDQVIRFNIMLFVVTCVSFLLFRVLEIAFHTDYGARFFKHSQFSICSDHRYVSTHGTCFCGCDHVKE